MPLHSLGMDWRHAPSPGGTPRVSDSDAGQQPLCRSQQAPVVSVVVVVEIGQNCSQVVPLPLYWSAMPLQPAAVSIRQEPKPIPPSVVSPDWSSIGPPQQPLKRLQQAPWRTG